MQILFIVLNDLNYLDNVLKTLIKLEVRGATILESEGMAKAVLKNEGLSILLKGLVDSNRTKDLGSSKTIFTVIPNEEDCKRVASELQEVLSNSTANVVGFMFTLPVSNIYPLKKRS